MLRTLAVESARGVPSRLGEKIQTFLRSIRQVFNGERLARVQGSDQLLANVSRFQHTPLVPTASSTILSNFNRYARGILPNYLARNHFHNLAANMNRCYAFRLMSGSPRLYTGLSNRIALFGFVAISVREAVHNRVRTLERDDGYAQEYAVQHLIDGNTEIEFVSEPVPEADEVLDLSVVRSQSISGDSDITVINDYDDESDFEIISEMYVFSDEVNEVGQSRSISEESNITMINDDESDFEIMTHSDEVNEDEGSYDVVTELKELIGFEIQQSSNLRSCVQMLYKENAKLKEILHSKSVDESFLIKELTGTLDMVKRQEMDLEMLRKMTKEQNLVLKTQATSCKSKGVSPNPSTGRTSKDLRGRRQKRSGRVANSSEIDMEQLRAEGGRVRALKIHRKQRYRRT